MNEPKTIRAQNAPWYNGIEFLVMGTTTGPGVIKQTVAAPLEMREMDVQNMRVEPTFIMSHQQAQALMDDLYAAGLRPTLGMGSIGELKATQDHLADLRRLVFDSKP